MKNMKAKLKAKLKKKAAIIEYDLNCSYIHDNVDSELDKELNELVGHHSHSSGYMIGEDERDMTWSFPTKKEAMEALKKVNLHKRVHSAEIFKVEE